MDWENARWVKLYCQDTGTWLRIGWQGRTVALHLLRAVNASGVLSDLGEEPDLVLSELLRLPAEVVTPGLAALVRTETVTLAHGKLVWTKFLEAQKSRKSEAQRKAEYRAKHRAEAINAQGGTACPKCGTDNPETGHNCPQCPDKGDIESQNRKEKIRSEENRSDINPKTPATPVVSEGQQGSLPGLPPKQPDTKPAKTNKERKPKEPKPPKEPTAPTPGSIVYAAYREAFVRRYGVEPPWDNRTKTHFKRIATNTLTGRPPSCSDKDALAEACAVAARYVRHPDAHYTKQQHPPALLDRDWHKLVTEYRTGRTVTGTHARDSERMESNPILEYAAEVRAMEEAQRRRKAEVVDVEQ